MPSRLVLALITLPAALAACSHPPGGVGPDAAGDADAGDAGFDLGDAGPPPDLPPIPSGTIPCEAPDYWPLALHSEHHPFWVHYRDRWEEGLARLVLSYLDTSWQIEVDTLGFRPPLPDAGWCGPDADFDVYLWRGIDECYVDILGENPATSYDDEYAYLVVDPTGLYGGPILDSTLAHELNHAFQAADDWSDSAIVYEMTSTFIEDVVFDDDNQYVDQVADFQARPDWSLDRDDGYSTWYMYGAALYLHFVRERYFAGDARFVAEMWLRLRSPYAAGDPDFEDALETILRNRAGIGFLDSVVEMARWRVYTGARADAAHFSEGASYAEPARAGALRTSGGQVAISPMTLGSAYLDLTRQAGDPGAITVGLAGADTTVQWVVQVVPGAGASDGDILDLSSGPAAVDVTGARTLVITAVPRGTNDPDGRTSARRHATVTVAPR